MNCWPHSWKVGLVSWRRARRVCSPAPVPAPVPAPAMDRFAVTRPADSVSKLSSRKKAGATFNYSPVSLALQIKFFFNCNNKDQTALLCVIRMLPLSI